MTFDAGCFVCLQLLKPINILAMPCGHVMCEECYHKMYNENSDEKVCGKCRVPFTYVTKLYFDQSTEIVIEGGLQSDIKNEEEIIKKDSEIRKLSKVIQESKIEINALRSRIEELEKEKEIFLDIEEQFGAYISSIDLPEEERISLLRELIKKQLSTLIHFNYIHNTLSFSFYQVKKDIKKENKIIINKRMTFNFTCYVCLDQMNPNNMMAISCGHVMCGSCYDTMFLQRGEEKICGLCRHRFGSGLKLFLDNSASRVNETFLSNNKNDDDYNLRVIERLENDLKMEKCVVESLHFELKEKQLEIIEQKTIALALQREIEDNHEKINKLTKKLSEIENKPLTKNMINDPEYVWLFNLLNNSNEEKIKYTHKHEQDLKKNETKVNNKLNADKNKFHEVKINEKNLYDNIRSLKELLNEKDKKLENSIQEKDNLQKIIEELKKENKILHCNNNILEKELLRKNKPTRYV
uniref:RING-type domain-containing protein n=1 Tax=Strongyloides stercoralis TaxID=6248 RepID=A0AAF5CSC8_STRER